LPNKHSQLVGKPKPEHTMAMLLNQLIL